MYVCSDHIGLTIPTIRDINFVSCFLCVFYSNDTSIIKAVRNRISTPIKSLFDTAERKKNKWFYFCLRTTDTSKLDHIIVYFTRTSLVIMVYIRNKKV